MGKEKHIAVIGAGPGGLTSAMILARNGYRVSVYEAKSRVGGRNARLSLGPYHFDTGPTFLMMPPILREMFEMAGRKQEDYLDSYPLDPMYQLSYHDLSLSPTSDHDRMQQEIARLFPGNEKGLDRFLRKEGRRFRLMDPCLRKPYSSFGSMFSRDFLKALPFLSVGKSMYGMLGHYFTEEKLKISFTFQAKYLGMSPWQCPAAFTMIPYIEHEYGIEHVTGGLSEISSAMARILEEHGGKILLNTTVKQVITRDRRATGLLLENGQKVETDAVIVNADFGYAMENLFAPGVIRKYHPRKLRKKLFSCSILMFYLGVDKKYPDPHHHIIITRDYRKNINEIVSGTLSEEPSIYVRNASVNDPTLAPEGHSALYVLVPVPNTLSGIQWNDAQVQRYREKVFDIIRNRTSMKDVTKHIVQEKVITPQNWEEDYNVFLGATFNLGHSINQMLYFRPHNRFEEVKDVYLVGGGTHPGSGLPTIYESGRISAQLIMKQ
jgi:phytoene desaturase